MGQTEVGYKKGVGSCREAVEGVVGRVVGVSWGCG